MMSIAIWKQLRSPELSPSTISLHTWDGHSSHSLVMYHNCLVTLVSKTIHVNIKVIDALIDYNILLGHSYTYAMLVITYVVLCKMCFPHERKVINIDHLTYYELSSLTSPKSIILSMPNKQSSTPLASVSLRVYKYSSLFGAFPDPPPPISEPSSLSVCMLQASRDA